jgi:hypothetical protein
MTVKPTAGDPLMQPFKIFEDQKGELDRLRKSTLEGVWVHQGKSRLEIVPKDPEEFAELSRVIEVIEAKIAHNQDVLIRLEAECKTLDIQEYSLYRLINRRAAIPAEIQAIKKETDWDLEYIFNAAATLGNRDAAEKHPIVVAARGKAAEKIDPLEAEAKDLTKKITKLETILAEFQV